MKLTLITLCILIFAISAQTEPYIDSDGCLTITWDTPTEHATLSKYFIRILDSEGDIKKQDETILNRYDWIYALEGFVPGETVTVKVWAVGVTVDLTGKIIPSWSEAAVIMATLNENTTLTAPLNGAVY